MSPRSAQPWRQWILQRSQEVGRLAWQGLQKPREFPQTLVAQQAHNATARTWLRTLKEWNDLRYYGVAEYMRRNQPQQLAFLFSRANEAGGSIASSTGGGGSTTTATAGSPPPSATPTSSAPPPPAKVAFMITARMREQLNDLGYTPNDIKQLKPAEASLLLEHNVTPADKDERLAALTSEPVPVETPPPPPRTTTKSVHTIIQRAQTRSTAEHLQVDRTTLWHPYTSLTTPSTVLPVAAAAGCTLTLEDGTTKLVDGMASWWSVIHGYRHATLNKAATTQINQHMAHVMFGGLTHRPAVTLGELLVEIVAAAADDDDDDTALRKVFLADSGSVSVEIALKMALQYQRGRGKPHKTAFMALRSGYHGDTLGAMSVCDPVNGMHSAFADNLMSNTFLPRPPCDVQFSLMANADGGCAGCTCQRSTTTSTNTAPPLFSTYEDALEASCVEMEAMIGQHAATTAAVIVEPLVQGAGGMRFYDVRYLQRLRAACTQHDVLLIADEIATGFGRAGGNALLACTAANVQPDILTLGKALTGGYMTLAAVLTTDQVGRGVSMAPGPDQPALPLMHGPTFMGNPLACSVAIASLQVLCDPHAESYYMTAIPRIERHLRMALQPATDMTNTVADVRVRGAIGVIERRNPLTNMELVAEICQHYGAWLRPFGKLVYTMPPYVATTDDLDKISSAMLALAEVDEDNIQSYTTHRKQQTVLQTAVRQAPFDIPVTQPPEEVTQKVGKEATPSVTQQILGSVASANVRDQPSHVASRTHAPTQQGIWYEVIEEYKDGTGSEVVALHPTQKEAEEDAKLRLEIVTKRAVQENKDVDVGFSVRESAR